MPLATWDPRFSIERPRLVAALERSLVETGFALLVAPGGYGKSTVLDAWRAGSHDVVTRIDAGESQPGPGRSGGILWGRRVPISPPFDCEAAHARLEDALARASGTTVVDGIDGMRDRRARELFRKAAADRGRSVRWIFSLRRGEDAPVPPGWTGDPIDEAELRFDFEETRMLALRSGRPFDESALRTILEITNGWPAAVVAAMRAAARDEEPAQAARDAMRLLFTRYVLAPATPDDRRFLLRTCLFDGLTREVLEAMDPAATARLARMRAELPVVGSASAGAFRYDPRLLEALRSVVRRSPEIHARAVREAGTTLARMGGYEGALRLAIAERHADCAGDLLERYGRRLLDRGRTTLVREALARIDPERLAARVRLAALRAEVGGVGELASAVRLHERAVTDGRPPQDRAVAALGAAGLLGRAGRPAEAAALLAAVGRAAPTGSPAIDARVLAAGAAFHVRSGTMGDALQRAGRALAIAASSGDALLGAVVNRSAAEVHAAAGRYTDALRYATRGVELAQAAGAPPIELRARAVVFDAARNLGHAKTADAHLRALRLLATREGDWEIAAFGLCRAAERAVETCDTELLAETDAALAAIPPDRRRSYVEPIGGSLEAGLTRARALRAASEGRFDRAFAIVEARGFTTRNHAFATAALAMYAAAAGSADRSAAQRALGEDAVASLPDRTALDAVSARAFLVLASVLTGDGRAAREQLRKLDADGDRMSVPAIVLVRAARAAFDLTTGRGRPGDLGDAADELAVHGLGAYGAVLRALPLIPAAGAARLSPSERRILPLLCDGRTSREIAALTGRSVTTVDCQVKLLVKKLGVPGGRRGVVALARSGKLPGFRLSEPVTGTTA